MIEEKVHLTFKTERSVSEKLKIFAKSLNMTQPELIDSICKDFIELIEKTAEEELKKEGMTSALQSPK